MTKHITRHRRGVAGVPLCNGAPGCRFPQATCPHHGASTATRLTPTVLAFSAVDDGTCIDCGMVVHRDWCVHAPESARLARCAGELPGWTFDGKHWKHPSGADVFYGSSCMAWLVYKLPGGSLDVSSRRFTTPAEAAADALGFAIERAGDSARWMRDGKVDGYYASAEIAAVAALRFDADQHRAKAHLERDPNELPPGWVGVTRFSSYTERYAYKPADELGENGPRIGLKNGETEWRWAQTAGSSLLSCAARCSMYEAMRQARGLQNVEDLWAMP